MIIPKRDAKCYGAVHIDNYLTFTGFCKKVENDEVCDVDVFVDGKKVDTLKADKKIAKVEEIYDIENHGFLFELDEKYFERKHTLEFKASSGEELVNSKIQTIDKNHPKFNEYKFLHSLSTVDVEKIKDLYCKDAIGFLATEENLNDKDFVEYIKELMVRFPQATFKAFCFNNAQIESARDLFYGAEKDKFQLKILDNITELIVNIEIYINYVGSKDTTLKFFPIFEMLRKEFKEIFVIEYRKSLLHYSLYELDKLNTNNIVFTHKQYFNYSQRDYEIARGSFYSLVINTIMSEIYGTEYKIDLTTTFFETRLIFYVENALLYKKFKYYFFNLYQGELKSKQ